MKDMSEIDAGELKAAVTALNKMIDPKIKLIGAKKTAVCEKFKEAVQKFIDEDTVDQLPDVVVDFFNDNIADEDETEEVEEVKETKKSSGKKDTKSAGKGVKNTDGKPATKRARGESGESNEAVAYNILAGGGTDEDVATKFRSIYKERGVTDKEFINKRIKIYTGIAKRKLASEGKSKSKPAEKTEKKPAEKVEKKSTEKKSTEKTEKKPVKKPAKK